MSKAERSKNNTYLYEEVLQKNFEIIESFLNKFHKVFQKQDSIDFSIEKIEHRILSIEKRIDQQNQMIRNNAQIFENKLKVLQDYTSKQKVSPSSNFLFDQQFLITNSSKGEDKKDNDECYQKIQKIFSHFIYKALQKQNININCSQIKELSEKYLTIEKQILNFKQNLNNPSLCNKTIYQYPNFIECGSYAPQVISEQKTKQIYDSVASDMHTQIINEMRAIKQQLIINIKQKYNILQRNLTLKITERLNKINEQISQNKMYDLIRQEFQLALQQSSTRSNEIFANKLQTKNSLIYLQKKIKKREIVEGSNFKSKTQSSMEKNQNKSAHISFNMKSKTRRVGHHRNVSGFRNSLCEDVSVLKPKVNPVQIKKNGIQSDIITMNFSNKKFIDTLKQWNFTNTIS